MTSDANCSKGLLMVISAPSGCGKGTVIAQLLKDDNYYYSVSATTRAPRAGEIDGENYHFISKEKFENMINSGNMLEYAVYCENYYGTPKDKVDEMLCKGKNVVLEIEVQGAMQIKKLCPDAVFVFINPPSMEELERRLRKRGTETDDVIAKRIAKAEDEMQYSHQYDYVIVNDVLENAVDDLKTIVRAETLSTKRLKFMEDYKC